jgi:Chaperone of endosialidase
LNNTTGFSNTAVGNQALLNLNGGNGNIALGWKAGENIGTGNDNICIGHAGFNGQYGNIWIGSGVHSTCTIGVSAEFIVPCVYSSNTVSGTGRDVVVTFEGKLGTVFSSRRFKKDIADMDTASEALLSLRPVTFHYKPEIDKQGTPQFGLIAEEVDKVCPDLVDRGAKGEIDSVRYRAVNAMLLNEFLKEHKRVQQQAGKIEEQARKLEEQQATIAQLTSTDAKQQATITQLTSTDTRQQQEIQALTASLKEQGAQIQKVSDQLELNKPAPQIVDNQ